MLNILLLLGGCILALIVLAALMVGLIYLSQGDRRDTVSAAREDWINRRSENDE